MKSDLRGVKVSLIFPSFKNFRDSMAFIENVDYLGVIPPVNLSYVAAILEREGCVVQLIDASAEKLTREEAGARVAAFNPDFLGFTLTNLDFNLSLDWIRYFGREHRRPIVVGGILTRANGEAVLCHPEISYSVIGDADETLPELLRCVQAGGDLGRVAGIAYRDADGNVRRTAAREPLRDIDTRPFPARHLLKTDLYFSILSQRKKFTAGMSVFGCPYPCAYCTMRRTPMQIRSAKNIVDELEACQKELGIHEVDFFDPNIALNKGRVHEICRLIKQRKLDVTWSVRANLMTMDRDIMKDMASAGCAWVGYGIEAGDEGILKGLSKPQGGVSHIHEVLKATRESGMRTCGFFILGLPGETPETLRRTVDFIYRAPLDYVQIASFWPVPQTPIYEEIVRETGRDFWKENITAGLDPRPYLLWRTSFSLDGVKAQVHKAYMGFYFRPSYILRAILRIRSFGEIVYGVKAVAGMAAGFIRKLRKDTLPLCHGGPA